MGEVPPKLTSEQEKLLKRALGLIKATSRSMARNQGDYLWDELNQVGLVKCFELLVKHDSAVGDFLPFIYPYIRGAMLDHLRLEERDRIPAKAMLAASTPLLQTFEEGNLFEGESARRSRLDQARHGLAATLFIGMAVSPLNPEELLEIEQERAQVNSTLQEALATLDPADRQLIETYDLQERTLKQASEEAGIAYGTAGYRHTKALELLSKRIQSKLREV